MYILLDKVYEMNTVFVLSTSIAFFIYSYLNTYWVEEYLDLIRIDKWSNLFYFKDYKNNLTGESYNKFIIKNHNNFLTRLIFCPFCASFWLSVVFCLLLGFPSLILTISFWASLEYFLLKLIIKRSH